MLKERRKQFTFYASYFDAVMDLPKRRQWPTMLALIRYALEAAEPDENSLYSSSVFKSARPNIDSSRSRAEAKLREKRSPQGEPFAEAFSDGTPAFGDEPERVSEGEKKKRKKKNKNEYEYEKEREEENKQETKKKNAPFGALTGAEPPREPLSPALSEREAMDESFFLEQTGESEAAEAVEPETAELPESEAAEPRGLLLKEPETQEPYASMLREDGALNRAWEQYRQRGADGLGPPSEAEKLVVLCALTGIAPRRRASNLCARMARSG